MLDCARYVRRHRGPKVQVRGAVVRGKNGSLPVGRAGTPKSRGRTLSDGTVNIIGQHISKLRQPIADVWPVVDESGVVVDLLGTWDDKDYVCLDHQSEPVDEVAATHHLVSRAVYQASVLPTDWNVVALRRAARGQTRLENLRASDDDTLGAGREHELLVELNEGGGTVIAEIDTSPPFTHIVQLHDEFYLAQMKAPPEAATPEAQPAPAAMTSQATQADAQAVTDTALGVLAEAEAAETVEAGPVPAEAAAESPAVNGTTAETVAETVAEKVAAAAAQEAAAKDRPRRQRGKKRRATALKAVATPLDEEEKAAAVESAEARATLASSLTEGLWEAPRPPETREEKDDDALLILPAAGRSTDELESARAESYAQATAFVAAASSRQRDAPDAEEGLLTLEEVRNADCFAWDEFMNLYLPHVGFVAARPTKKPKAGGAPPQVAFVPRDESDVRPIGWHHLAGCGCEYCDARQADE
jgi:hypothetical protein